MASVLSRMLARLALTAFVTVSIGAEVHTRRPLDQPAAAPTGEWGSVRAAIDRGAYALAQREVRALMASLDATSLEWARGSDLLVEALLRGGRGDAESTLTLAEQTLALKEARAGAADLETATSLQGLAAIRLQRGEPRLALALTERSLAIRQSHVAPDASPIADSLDQAASALMALERSEEAGRRLTRSLQIREGLASTDPLGLARTLELVCLRLRNAGDYRSAAEPLQRLLGLRDQLPADHPDRAWTLQLQGDLVWLEGDGERARRIWTDAAALLERALGGDQAGLISLQRRVILANDVLGNRAEAAELMARALAVANRALAPCNPDRLALRVYAASRSAYEGVFIEARRAYRESLAANIACRGERHSNTATVVYNFALLASRMGDYGEAERLLTRTIRSWSATLGPSHPYVARAWDSLAGVAAANRQYVRARALYERALASRRRSGAPNPALIAWTMSNLAQTLVELGELTLARRYVDEALVTFRKGRAPDELDHLATVLALRGRIESRRGDYAAARASFAEALVERERILGSGHPLCAQLRVDVAAMDLRRGDTAAAFEAALGAEAVGREHLRFTMRYLPERQAVAYADRRPRGLDVAISAGTAADGTSDTVDASRLLDALIQSRGVILEELAARARTTIPQGPQASSGARAVAARQRYANLVVRSLQESVPRTRLDEARREKEDAEQALAEESATASAEIARAEAGLDAVRAALPADAALISFVRYDRTIVGASPTPTRWRAPTPSYAAFVLRADTAEPTLVPLGSAAAIDPLVSAWRREAAGHTLIAGATRAEAESSYRRAGLRLRRAIWDPLATPLTGAARIFIVPDGPLNVVNVAALPTTAGRFLADDPVLLHYVSTERDLVLPESAAVSSSLLAIGGATFDGRTETPDTSAARSACEEFSRMRFPSLPASRREVVDISRTWPTAAARDVTVLSGTAATETAFKREAAGRRVVHLATHGFFLGGECVPGMVGTRGVGGLARRPSSAGSDTDNPLLLSGLALAWANRRDKARTSEDDGILTAEEIAGLNLQGTEWAVLSACDTGLGEIKAGEGVFGLRRAFQVAGARTVIMSLWSVEDTSARVWMRALYDARFRQQRSTAEAVRDASRAVLAARRAQRQSTHPFFWGGFVAAGDWR
jgi:CHAT domain-containing protein/Tfp pilus assembly protein PilF